MEQQQIIENNKLIAEFMGVVLRELPDGTFSWSDTPFFYCSHPTKEQVIDSIANYAKYHTSWDWLIPVVTKIEGMGYWLNRIIGDVWIVDNEGKTIINNPTHQGGIEAVYLIVIDFINWYNQQQK